MGNFDLNEIANIVVLISAVIIAIKTIYAFFKQPVDQITEKSHKEEEKRIESVLEKKIPGLLEKNQSILMDSLDELKSLTLNQEERLTKVQNSIDQLYLAQKDMLRYDMNRIYYKYHPYKKILDADKKAFLKLYDDYKSMKGNTWIDELHKDLETWPIVASEAELKKE